MDGSVAYLYKKEVRTALQTQIAEQGALPRVKIGSTQADIQLLALEVDADFKREIEGLKVEMEYMQWLEGL